MENNINNSPLGYDHYSKLSADEIIEAKRQNRKHALERKKRIEEMFDESSKR